MSSVQRRLPSFRSTYLTATSAGALALTVAACDGTEPGSNGAALSNPPPDTTDGVPPTPQPTTTATAAPDAPDPPPAPTMDVTPDPAPSATTTDPIDVMPDGGMPPGQDPNMDDPGPASEPMPSPGCSGGNANATVPNAELQTPDGYDGSAPAPVLFAFHGAGGDSGSLQGPFANDARDRGYIGVYLKSSGSAWSVRDDTPLLDDAYDAVLENYCVDINRIFAVGHSSGAQMITQLLCDGETRFRAVAPVASSKYCNGWDPVNVINIHGVDDIERGGQGENRYGLMDGDGHIDFGVYHDSNQCTETSTEFDPGGNCGAGINPGCVEYTDCAARTLFCNHDDPQYGTSNHGVPCFASQVMFDFFDELL